MGCWWASGGHGALQRRFQSCRYHIEKKPVQKKLTQIDALCSYISLHACQIVQPGRACLTWLPSSTHCAANIERTILWSSKLLACQLVQPGRVYLTWLPSS